MRLSPSLSLCLPLIHSSDLDSNTKCPTIKVAYCLNNRPASLSRRLPHHVRLLLSCQELLLLLEQGGPQAVGDLGGRQSPRGPRCFEQTDDVDAAQCKGESRTRDGDGQ